MCFLTKFSSKIENGEQTTDVVLYRLIEDNYIIENIRTVACGVTQTFNVTSTLGLSGNKTVVSGLGTFAAKLNFFDKGLIKLPSKHYSEAPKIRRLNSESV